MNSDEATNIVRKSMAIDDLLFLDTTHTHRNTTASVRSKRFIYGGECHFDNIRRFFCR